jgi:hypothetical protein
VPQPLLGVAALFAEPLALADKGTDLRVMRDYLGHRIPKMTTR